LDDFQNFVVLQHAFGIAFQNYYSVLELRFIQVKVFDQILLCLY